MNDIVKSILSFIFFLLMPALIVYYRKMSVGEQIKEIQKDAKYVKDKGEKIKSGWARFVDYISASPWLFGSIFVIVNGALIVLTGGQYITILLKILKYTTYFITSTIRTLGFYIIAGGVILLEFIEPFIKNVQVFIKTFLSTNENFKTVWDTIKNQSIVDTFKKGTLMKFIGLIFTNILAYMKQFITFIKSKLPSIKNSIGMSDFLNMPKNIILTALCLVVMAIIYLCTISGMIIGEYSISKSTEYTLFKKWYDYINPSEYTIMLLKLFGLKSNKNLQFFVFSAVIVLIGIFLIDFVYLFGSSIFSDSGNGISLIKEYIGWSFAIVLLIFAICMYKFDGLKYKSKGADESTISEKVKKFGVNNMRLTFFLVSVAILASVLPESIDIIAAFIRKINCAFVGGPGIPIPILPIFKQIIEIQKKVFC